METYTVTTFEDENNGITTGKASLREAIAAANNNEGPDTINFDSSLTEGVIQSKGGQGPLEIADPVTIKGLGRNKLTVDAQGKDPDAANESRVFAVNDGSESNEIAVTLEGMTVMGGIAASGDSFDNEFPGDFGGGIFNRENLTLTDVEVSKNRAGYGGGVHNAEGTITLANSKISGNSAASESLNEDGNGGGINNYNGTTILESSTISGNSSNGDGGGISNVYGSLDLSDSQVTNNDAADQASGGGIFSSEGTVTLKRSTMSDNTSVDRGSGGAITNQNSLLTVINSTISGNRSGDGGGTIFNSSGSTANMSNSTISNNADPSRSRGGAINNEGDLTLASSTVTGNFVDSSTAGEGTIYNQGNLAIANSIIANSSGDGKEFAGNEPTLLGTNLVEDGSLTGNNVINSDPQLSQLQDNGGPTLTHALKSASPAIDAGDNAFLAESELEADLNGDLDTNDKLTTEQRGEGFPRVIGDNVDLGAIENQVTPPAFTLDVDGNGQAKALSDGILATRYLFGFEGQTLTQGAVGQGASRSEADQIASFLDEAGDRLDVDGNGSAEALTDGILLTRYLFGFEGQTLTQGAIGEGASRSSPEAVANYLQQFQPSGNSALQAQDISEEIPELEAGLGSSTLTQSEQSAMQSPGDATSLQPEQAHSGNEQAM